MRAVPEPPGPSTLLRLRILLWHARPFLVVGALVLVGFAVVRAVAPPPAPTTAVIVASRDVPAGTELSAADLGVARFPPHLVPEAALRADDDALGRRTAVALSRGTVLSQTLLAGERFAVTPPAGAVIVPVRLSAASTAGLLRPGDRIDLVAPPDVVGPGPLDATAGTAPVPDDGTSGPPSAQGREPVTLAHGALVLEVDGSDDASSSESSGLVPSVGAEDRVTVVAVTPAEGRRLASVTVRGVLGAVLVP